MVQKHANWKADMSGRMNSKINYLLTWDYLSNT